jgi:hypothetical protein
MPDKITEKSTGDYPGILRTIVNDWVIEELECIPKTHMDRLYFGFIPKGDNETLVIKEYMTTRDIRIGNKKISPYDNQKDYFSEIDYQGRNFAQSRLGIPVFVAICSDNPRLTDKKSNDTVAEIIVAGRSADGFCIGGEITSQRLGDGTIDVSNVDFKPIVELNETIQRILEKFYEGYIHEVG